MNYALITCHEVNWCTKRYAMFIWWLLPSVCPTPRRTFLTNHNLMHMKLSKFILPSTWSHWVCLSPIPESLPIHSILQKSFFQSSVDLTVSFPHISSTIKWFWNFFPPLKPYLDLATHCQHPGSVHSMEWDWNVKVFFFFNFIFNIYFIEVQLIYNVVLVSGVQPNNSVFLQYI